jgi:hypothetical protein
MVGQAEGDLQGLEGMNLKRVELDLRHGSELSWERV